MLVPFATRTHETMKEVLMDSTAPGPEIHYYMIRGGVDKTNITVWESGLVGQEYIKTYGHYHVGGISETYKVIQGEGVVLLQTRKENGLGNFIDDEIENFFCLKVKIGDSVFIPSGTAHLVANTGKIWLVTSDNSPVNFEEVDAASLPGHADYEPIKKLQGFAYYLIEEEGLPKLVKNPKYKVIPEPEWLTTEQYALK